MANRYPDSDPDSDDMMEGHSCLHCPAKFSDKSDLERYTHIYSKHHNISPF